MRHSGDGRTSFTNGAIFLVSIGEPKIQSETAYPVVNTARRDISFPLSDYSRHFPVHPAAQASLLLLSATLSSDGTPRRIEDRSPQLR